MNEKDNLSAALEDYLEAIYNLEKKSKIAKVTDIAELLNVKKASVNYALNSLAEKGFVNYEPYKIIELTQKGKDAAKEIINTHNILKNFFINVLKIDEKEAENIACRSEHIIKGDSLKRFTKFIEFIDNCPALGKEWGKLFEKYYSESKENVNCKQCFDEYVDRLLKKHNKLHSADLITLNEAKINEKVRIMQIKLPIHAKKKLVDLGFTLGTIIYIAKTAPFDDPLDVVVKGTHISLRRSQAKDIIVERVHKEEKIN